MAEDRPHILYVAFSYPPSHASGVYRALAMSNAFAAADWDVTVLTTTVEYFEDSTGVDPSLMERVDPRIHSERVPFLAGDGDVSGWPWLRARWPELWQTVRNRRDLGIFPERKYATWRPAIAEAAERIHRQHPVDLVVATANPHVDFTVGKHLKDLYGVPYVMDYRDAWSLDVFSGRTIATTTSAQGKAEAELLADASAVWFVNDAILQWHQRQYPEAASRMRVVANGFDPVSGGHATTPRQGREQGLRFGYIGTMTGQVPLEDLFNGWEIAVGRSRALAGAELRMHGYLGHSSQSDERMRSLFDTYRELGVHYAGPVGKAEIADAYAQMDALVLALGTGQYVTSGKVYEYASTGKPIVSVHDPGNATTAELSAYPLWVPTAELEPASIAAALEAVAEIAMHVSADDIRQAQDFAEKFSRAHQLQIAVDDCARIIR